MAEIELHQSPQPARSPIRTGRRFVFLCVLAVLTLSLVNLVGLWQKAFVEEPLGFDEAYNLEIVHNLRVYGEYRSFKGDYFDPLVTTGPTVLIPLFVFNSLSSSPVSIRASKVGIFSLNVLAATALFSLFRRRTGHLQALVLALLAFTIVYLCFGRNAQGLETRVLGEGPGVMFELIGVSLMGTTTRRMLTGSDRWRFFLAGVLFGFASLAKLVYILAVPAVFVALFAQGLVTKTLRRSSIALSLVLAGFATPNLVWEIVKYVSLNNYASYCFRMVYLMTHLNGGAFSGPCSGGLVQHARAQFGSLLLDHGQFLRLGVVNYQLLFLFGLALLVLRLASFGLPSLAASVLTVHGLGHLTWYCFLNPNPWYRHAFPGVTLLFVGLFVDAVGVLARPVSRAQRTRFARLARVLAAAYLLSAVLLGGQTVIQTLGNWYISTNTPAIRQALLKKKRERRLVIDTIETHGLFVYSGSDIWYNPDKEVGLFLGHALPRIQDVDVKARPGKLLLVTPHTAKPLIKETRETMIDGTFYSIRRF